MEPFQVEQKIVLSHSEAQELYDEITHGELANALDELLGTGRKATLIIEIEEKE